MWFIIALISNNYYTKPHQRRKCCLTAFFSRICCASISKRKKKKKRQQSYNVLAHHCAECSFFPFLKREHLKRWHLEHLVKICFCTEKNFLSGNALSKWLFIRDMEASLHGCDDDSNWKWRSGTPQSSSSEAPKAHHYSEGADYWHCPRVTRAPETHNKAADSTEGGLLCSPGVAPLQSLLETPLLAFTHD